MAAVWFLAAMEDVSVSSAHVRSFVPTYLHSFTQARVFSSSCAKITHRTVSSFATAVDPVLSTSFAFTTITYEALLSSFDKNLIPLLYHDPGPGLVDLHCPDHHKYVPGLVLLLHHGCGPGIVI